MIIHFNGDFVILLWFYVAFFLYKIPCDISIFESWTFNQLYFSWFDLALYKTGPQKYKMKVRIRGVFFELDKYSVIWTEFALIPSKFESIFELTSADLSLFEKTWASMNRLERLTTNWVWFWTSIPAFELLYHLDWSYVIQAGSSEGTLKRHMKELRRASIPFFVNQ